MLSTKLKGSPLLVCMRYELASVRAEEIVLKADLALSEGRGGVLTGLMRVPSRML